MVGTFNERPVEKAGVRGLAEYLWFKWNRDVGGTKALSSFGNDQGTILVHVIYEVQTSRGDWNLCDELRLYRLEFRVSRTTGEIVMRRILQRSVTGVCRGRT